MNFSCLLLLAYSFSLLAMSQIQRLDAKPGLKYRLGTAPKSSINVLRRVLDSVPVQAATMGRSGEEELWLAQGKALRDPRPDVPHLLGTDDLRGEGVRVKSQLHISPGDDAETWRDGREYRM